MATTKPTNHMKNMGVRIKAAREKKFEKSLIAAERWGVTAATWSGYESGKQKFTVEKIVDLADFLNVDVNWLITGRETVDTTAIQKELTTLTNTLNDKLEVIAALKESNQLLRDKLESTSDNSDLVKIAEKAIELFEQRRANRSTDKSSG